MGPEANNQGIRSLNERRLNPERRVGRIGMTDGHCPQGSKGPKGPKGNRNAKPEPKPKRCLLWQIGKLGEDGLELGSVDANTTEA